MILNLVPVDKNSKILRINSQNPMGELLEQEKKRRSTKFQKTGLNLQVLEFLPPLVLAYNQQVAYNWDSVLESPLDMNKNR